MGDVPTVRVLGPVEVVVDGVPRTLAPQERVIVAVLAAGADDEVPRDEIAAAVWARPPQHDLLAPLMNRVRRRLSPDLVVTSARGRHGHRLRRPDGPPAGDLVDAHRFAGLVESAERALTGGRAAHAAELAAAAAALWRGPPFGLDDDRPLPARCRFARDRIEGLRRRLLRCWARAGLLTESHAVLDHLEAGTDESDEVWLLRLVRDLAAGESGEQLIDDRRRRTGRYDDPAIVRAFALQELAECGQQIRSTDVVPPTTAGSGAARRLIEASIGAHRSGRPVSCPAADAPDRRAWHAACLDAGIALVHVRADVLRGLLGELWALVLRDPRNDPAPLQSRVGAMIGGPSPAPFEEPAGLFDLVVTLLGLVARRQAVLVVIDHAGTDAADPAVRDRAAALLERTPDRLVGVVVVDPDRAAPAAGAPTGSAWLAAAALVADPDLRFDLVMIEDVLREVDDRTGVDADLGRAVLAGAFVPYEPLRLTDESRREVLRWLWSDPTYARRMHAAASVVLARNARIAQAARRPPQATVRQWVLAADHSWRARPALPDGDVVAVHLAASRALRSAGDSALAAELTGRGLALADDPALRYELYLLHGDALHDRGRMAFAAAAYEAAHDVAASPRARGEALVRMARRWSDPGRVDTQLVARLRAGLAELSDPAVAQTHRDLWMQVGAHLAHKTTMAVPGAVDGVAQAELVLGSLTGATPPEVACEVLVECRWAIFDHVRPSRTRELSSRLADRSAEAGSVHHRGEALITGIVDVLRLGDVPKARAMIEDHRDHVARTAHGLGPYLQRGLDTLLDLWDGHLATAADRLADEVDVMTAEHPSADRTDSLVQTWLGQRFWLRHEQGRLDELRTGVEGALVARRQFFPVWMAGTAYLHAATGRVGPAVDQLEMILAAVDGFPLHGWTVPTLALVVEAVDVLPDHDHLDVRRRVVAQVEPRLAPLAGELVLAGWPTVMLGPVTRSLALLALAAGDPERAEAHAAAGLASVAGAPAQVAWMRVHRARALVAMGGTARTAEAADLVAAAAAVAADRGLETLLRTARMAVGRP